ncbi:hypothetical protein V6N13_047432 [Hibiscus sabdariffa]
MEEDSEPPTASNEGEEQEIRENGLKTKLIKEVQARPRISNQRVGQEHQNHEERQEWHFHYISRAGIRENGEGKRSGNQH